MLDSKLYAQLVGKWKLNDKTCSHYTFEIELIILFYGLDSGAAW